jgi:hypothetical protein
MGKSGRDQWSRCAAEHLVTPVGGGVYARRRACRGDNPWKPGAKRGCWLWRNFPQYLLGYLLRPIGIQGHRFWRRGVSWRQRGQVSVLAVLVRRVVVVRRIRHERTDGFAVGDHLIISCEPVDVHVSYATMSRVFVAWPWREIDPESRAHWDGTMGFSRDPNHWDWRNTPWRLEPDPSDVSAGDVCMVGIPSTEVQVVAIEQYDPAADFGWAPRPVWALGVCPVDNLADDEAGYVLYLNSGEPIVINPI